MIGSLSRGALRSFAIRLTLLAIFATALLGVLVAIPGSAAAVTTVTVDSTGDAADADGGTNATCATAGGVCTLRAAIQTANGGFADQILFALPGGSGTINLTSELPVILVDLAIDASGNTVIIDGTGGGPATAGFEVHASLAGQNFSLVSGTGDLTIRDITGVSTDQTTGDAAVKVCGRSACSAEAANINLGTVLIDDITIEGITGARGVHVVANNLSDVTVSNSDITAAHDGVLLKADGDKGTPPEVTDNTLAVTGNDITSTGNDAVDIEVCDDTPCDLASKIAITVDGNTHLESSSDSGVEVDVDIDEATAFSAINVTVDTNTGGITGYDAVNIDLDFDDPDTGNLSASVSVSGNQGAIVGSGGEGVQANIRICCATSDHSSTVLIDDNDDITGDDEGVQVNSYVCCGDDNGSTVSVSGNGNITGTSAYAVAVYADVESGDRNESNVSVNDNGDIIATSAQVGVRVDSFAGGDSDDNDSIVKVNGNGAISGEGDAVLIDSFAGDTDGEANGNTSDVEVNNNGNITGDSDDLSAGHGVKVNSQAGNDGCCDDGSGNASLVDVSNNADISAGEDAIRILSEAGSRGGTSADNSSDVTVNSNGHLEGDRYGNGEGDGVHVESRAGTQSGEGNGNSSTVTITGDSGHDVSGGDDAIEIKSEAGALTGGGGDNNTSDVSVTGHRDIFTTSSDNAVEILSQAGAFGGVGDNNHATADVSANRFITAGGPGCAGFCPYGNAILIGVLAGGSDSASDTSSTSASVTSNDDISGYANGVGIVSFVCCDSANTNDITINQNQDITGGYAGIIIQGAFGGGVCCSQNTIDIVDNEGTISGGSDDSIDIEVEGEVPGSHTNLTISGNDISGGGATGIAIQNACCSTGPGADFSGSTISGNNVSNNDGAGIFLNAVNGLTIGPDNVIENNDGNGKCCTGIHIVEWDGEADFNTITQNSIFDNEGLGIDLDDGNCVAGASVAGCSGADLVGCKNIPAGAEGGVAGGPPTRDPNECIGFPIGVEINNKLLTGTACPDCEIEIFLADATPADQEGPGAIQYGEGKTYLMNATANGEGTFTVELPCGLGGEQLTMTATGKFGSTSEFGPNFPQAGLQANPCDVTDTPTNTPTNTPGGPTDTPTPTPSTGSIQVCKDTNPETSGTSFDFDTDIPGMTDPDLEDDECDIELGVDPGTYEITENPPSDWELDDIDCTGTSSSNIDVDLATDTVTIDLDAGDDVTCTFTNVESVAATPTATATATATPTATPTVTATPESATETPTPTDTPVPPTATATNTPVIPATPGNTIGDVNKNGVVNAIDAQLILQAEAGFITLANPKNADVNLDGTVDSRDAFLIQQFVAALIQSLPV